MKPKLSLTTHSSLLARIKNLDDQESWREFCRIYSDLIRRLALKSRLTQDEAEDVLQEVLVSVARNIGGFKYDRKVSSFKRWLSNMTRWRIADQRRKRLVRGLLYGQAPDETRRTDLLERIPNPAEPELEAAWNSEWGKSLMDAVLARVKKRVNAKDYQIYFLHVLREEPVAEVCRRLKVNRGQVYLAKLRVGRMVEKEIKMLKAREE